MVRSVVWKEACWGCGLYSAYSMSVVNVWMTLVMSIVDLCLLRLMCGLAQ